MRVKPLHRRRDYTSGQVGVDDATRLRYQVGGPVLHRAQIVSLRIRAPLPDYIVQIGPVG